MRCGLTGLCELHLNKISAGWIGALNWATGETVAVKEIQLSNIPKSELGEIMVRSFLPFSLDIIIHSRARIVRDRFIEEPECEPLDFWIRVSVRLK